ncbi:MAG: hypothetical protein JWM21_428 [Acidobacteria bacterium]|nr:hypothetical protein [Acidobacteriota bacterium]
MNSCSRVLVGNQVPHPCSVRRLKRRVYVLNYKTHPAVTTSEHSDVTGRTIHFNRAGEILNHRSALQCANRTWRSLWALQTRWPLRTWWSLNSRSLGKPRGISRDRIGHADNACARREGLSRYYYLEESQRTRRIRRTSSKETGRHCSDASQNHMENAVGHLHILRLSPGRTDRQSVTGADRIIESECHAAGAVARIATGVGQSSLIADQQWHIARRLKSQ